MVLPGESLHRSVAMVAVLLGASLFPVGAPLRVIMFLLHRILGVKTQFSRDVRRRRLASCPPWRRHISRPALVWQWWWWASFVCARWLEGRLARVGRMVQRALGC
jgi:hypothetical protein